MKIKENTYFKCVLSFTYEAHQLSNVFVPDISFN